MKNGTLEGGNIGFPTVSVQRTLGYVIKVSWESQGRALSYGILNPTYGHLPSPHLPRPLARAVAEQNFEPQALLRV